MHQTNSNARDAAARAGGAPWMARVGAGLLAASLALSGTGAAAGPTDGPDAGGGRQHHEAAQAQRMARLVDALELTADQRDQVAAILSDAREAGRAAWREARAQREAGAAGADRADGEHGEDSENAENAMRAQMTSLRADVRERLAGVLTPAQLSEFDALREDRLDARAERRELRRERRFERLSGALALHESQEQPVRAVLTRAQAQRAALMREGRVSGLEREALRAELEMLRKRTDTELGTILTPEQMERMTTLREARAERWREAKQRRARDGESRPRDRGRDRDMGRGTTPG